MSLLEAKKINLSFSGVQVLFDLDFELLPNEIHCICGENGAGKSCFVKILSGIYNHYTGEIFIGGKHIVIANPIVSREIGIFSVQQHRDLVPTLNAVENIFLGSEIFKKSLGRQLLDFKKMYLKANELVSKFNENINLNIPVKELKVSEQEIIAICKALANNSKILLIDEATAPLDQKEREHLYVFLKNLRDEGKGIIYISHHLEEIFNIGNRVTIFRNGKNVGTFNVDQINKDDLISYMTGKKVLQTYSSCKSSLIDSKTSIIEFKDISSINLRNISFSVRKGEVVGFAGLEGSFKEEIAYTAFGLIKNTKGDIFFNGKELKSNHPIESIRLGIGLVPNDRKKLGIFTNRNVAENIIITSINKNSNKIINFQWVKNIVYKYIKGLNIRTSGITQLLEYLSGGNQQKVLLSKWLEAQPEVLFLIDPTEGIDVGARADLYQILKKLPADGKSLIIFSSDIDELLILCDRIFTMVDGEIVNSYDIECADKKVILSDITSRNLKDKEKIYA